MQQNLTESVRKALDLIRSGEMDAARPILLEVLRQDERVEQAWFLLSYTLPTGEKQEFALNQALSINPEFDRAQDRLDRIRGETVESSHDSKLAEVGEAAQEKTPPSDANANQEVDDVKKKEPSPFPDETFLEGQDLDTESVKIRVSKRTLALTGLIILFLIILVLVFFPGILTNFFGLDQPVVQPTLVKGFRTLPPTWTP